MTNPVPLQEGYVRSEWEKIIHILVRRPDELTALEADVISRAKTLHPHWEVKVWRCPVANLDEPGFLLQKYWSRVNSGAQFADLLRLEVLYKFGGVYLDSDLKLFKPLDELIDRYEFFIASEDGVFLSTGVIGARKGSAVLRLLIDEIVRHEPDWSRPPNETTGPHFFTRQLKWHKEVTVLPRESFYPHNPFFFPKKVVHRHSFGEHLWLGSWLPSKADTNSPGRSSNLNRLQRALGRCAKRYVKNIAMRAFRLWHRIKSSDPSRPSPRIKSYHCADEIVVETVHGYRIVLDGRDISLTPELVFRGYYELPEENFLKRFVKSGDWVVDVGANVGSFSLLAAQLVGPFGRVFSFEPNPRPSELMSRSLVINWMHERVVQRRVAVGDRAGIVELSFISNRLGDAQVDHQEVRGLARSQTLRLLDQEQPVFIKVPCVRLDDEFPIDLPIKVLKIDVEGNEGQVLAGAARLVSRRCIDFIVLEMLHEAAGLRWDETLAQVQQITSWGYKVCTLTDDGSLVEQKDLNSALQIGCRNVVLAAREQYRSS